MPRYKVKEYATITVLYECEIEADKITDAVEKAQQEGEWVKDESYEAAWDETEYDVKEIEEDD